jgi:glutaminase
MKKPVRNVLAGATLVGLGLACLTVPRLAAQAPGDVQPAVDAAFKKFQTLKEGKNADYIPALAKVGPNLFGIAVVTADGLPAKSGVGGGIIAVSPGKFGIAVVSPPLDDAGNSVRAQRAIEAISNQLGGNPYAPRPPK